MRSGRSLPYLREFFGDKRVLFLSGMWVVYAGTAGALGGDVRWDRVGLAAGAGLLFFFVLEYFAHRFLLHGRMTRLIPKGAAGHMRHHDNPDDMKDLLTPNVYNVPWHPVLWGIASWSWHDGMLGSVTMLGFTGYQLYYEWSHYVTHRPIVPLTPWGRRMKKHHLLHHFDDPNRAYGVTNPLLDLVAGTSRKPGPEQGKDRGGRAL